MQGLLLTNNVALVAVNGLAGFALASDKAMATLPVTCYVLGSAIASIPASRLMRRIGRSRGYQLGAATGVLGCLLAFAGVYFSEFWLLCLGTLVAGVYPAFSSTLRFAAAELAEQRRPAMKAKAISWVLMGGILGGVLGPELSKLTRTAMPGLFSATYLALAALGIVGIFLARRVQIAPPSEVVTQLPARPLSEILRAPDAIVAVIGAMVAYGVMNLLMVATPLAMDYCKFPFSDAAFVLEWHVIGMFAPGLVTGHIIARFGSRTVMLAGCVLMLVCCVIALMGVDLMNFLSALFLLGVGWNFLFTGATHLLTESHRPSERGKVQGFNEFCVFATMITSSLSSGALLEANGWALLNWVSIPLVVAMGLLMLWRLLKSAPKEQLP